MSIPVVVNFDTTRIPKEGSSTFREDASYAWGELPNVIDSMNISISAQNDMSTAIALSESNAKASAESADASSVAANTYKDEVAVMKGEVLEAKEHIDGVNDGIDSAIADAVNSQLGEFTDKINKNSTRRKMSEFGLKLL